MLRPVMTHNRCAHTLSYRPHLVAASTSTARPSLRVAGTRGTRTEFLRMLLMIWLRWAAGTQWYAWIKRRFLMSPSLWTASDSSRGSSELKPSLS